MQSSGGAARLALAAVLGLTAQVQEHAPARAEMTRLVETERAFVKRAQQTNWRDAFLEYFADGITGLDGEDVKARLRARPAPPKELEFWWEPRYGDIAASGELGWLTGPVRTVLPQVGGGQPEFANYASIWRRQPDGRYLVIEDVGINTPDMPSFAPGFTRAPVASRYEGPERRDAAQLSLAGADRELIERLQQSQAEAYAAAAAPFARLHRPRTMPIVGRDAVVAWARTQPVWMSGTTGLAVAAESGDLGYTRGAYTLAEAAGAKPQSGYYLRIWTRDRDGEWRIVLDVTQAQ